jgi:hypothetical protein
VFVVVITVGGVAVLSVTEVDVSGVTHPLVATRGTMDVHVAAVRHVLRGSRVGPVVDMVAIGMVDMTIVEIVGVVAVQDTCMTAPQLVDVVVRLVARMGWGDVPADIEGHDAPYGVTPAWSVLTDVRSCAAADHRWASGTRSR